MCFSRQLLCLETNRTPAVANTNKQHAQCDSLRVQQKGQREDKWLFLQKSNDGKDAERYHLGCKVFSLQIWYDVLTSVKGCSRFMQSIICQMISLLSHPEGTDALNNTINCASAFTETSTSLQEKMLLGLFHFHERIYCFVLSSQAC